MRAVVLCAVGAIGLSLSVGCHGVDTTGRSGMAGRLVDASGQPIVGQRIQSLEAEGVTGEDGSFSVAWKDPETAIFFDREGIHWQRSYRREDDGQVVQLSLPATESVSVQCGAARCGVEMRWEASTGLRARVRHDCEPGVEFSVNLPPGEPELHCPGPVADTVWRLKRDGSSAELVSD